jgi:hypothetical protein
MYQTRLESFIEANINTFSGFGISLLFWVFVVIPVWHLNVTMFDNLIITCCFTVLSIIRGYVWRRFFNAGMHKTVHRIVAALVKRGWVKANGTISIN